MVTVGFGDVFLDYIVEIEDEFIGKISYGQERLDDLTLATLKRILYDVEAEYEGSFKGGGNILFTLGLMAWLKESRHDVVLFAAVGDDANGIILNTLIKRQGVVPKLAVTNVPTSLRVCLESPTRSIMLGNYLTGPKFDTNFIMNDKKKYFLRAELVMMESLYLHGRKNLTTHILQTCKHTKVPFVFKMMDRTPANILEDMKRFAKSCDVLIGNHDALSHFCSMAGIEQGPQRWRLLASDVCETSDKVVVITNGPEDVMCFHDIDVLEYFRVPNLPKDKIKSKQVDAGDAFVAGFCYGFLQNYALPICVRFGCWMAQSLLMFGDEVQSSVKPNDILNAIFLTTN